MIGSPFLYALSFAPGTYVDFYGDGTDGAFLGSVVGHRVVFGANFNLHDDERLRNFAGDQSGFAMTQCRELSLGEMVSLVQN